MGSVKRARVLFALIAAWPAVALGLQLGFDVDPWKLMGFGMYATPPRRPVDLRVRVEVLTLEGWQDARVDESDPVLASFRGRQQALGEVADAQPLLEHVSRRYRGAPVRAQWESPRLDREGRVVTLRGAASR